MTDISSSSPPAESSVVPSATACPPSEALKSFSPTADEMSSSSVDESTEASKSSSVKAASASSSTTPTSTPPLHPDYKDAKTLLISSKRPRSFLERTARELLAGGTDVIILSALGDAIALCVQLQSTLEEKKAASCIKIETTYNPYGPQFYGSYTAGLRIYMRKHPDFRGSRISPGYVTFCVEPEEGDITPCYDLDPKERVGSVNEGNVDLFVGGEGINRAFATTLEMANQSVDKYEALHKVLLEKTLKENAEKTQDEDVRSVQLDNLEEIHPNLKFALCRPCRELQDKHPSRATGATFVSVFKEGFAPHGKENNMAMVYVVGPRGCEFDSKESFLDGVHATAGNLMTALCDYNGMARRQGVNKGMGRMNTCRVCLFSGGASKHSAASKEEVAQAILGGLADGYRHGPAPRVNFTFEDNVFKQVWTDTTGLEVFDHQMNGFPTEENPEA